MFQLIPFGQNERRMMRYGNRNMDPFFSLFNAPAMCTDIEDNGNHFLMSVELPGFDKDDIKVSLEGNLLKIAAEHTQANTDENKNYVMKERSFSSFSRQFNIEGIDREQIKVKYAQGILRVELPKIKPQEPEQKYLAIEIED